MNYRYLMICCLLTSCLFLNACATALTISAPEFKEVALGEERNAGRQISINYRLVEGSKEFTLLKQLYCMETAKEKTVFRKRIRGVIPGVIEIPLLGLGLADLVIAKQLAINSERVEDVQVVETGSIIDCGDYSPADNVELVIQCPETGQIAYASTGSSGEIAVKDLFAGFLQNSQLNIFVRDDRCFAYVSTLQSSYN